MANSTRAASSAPYSSFIGNSRSTVTRATVTDYMALLTKLPDDFVVRLRGSPSRPTHSLVEFQKLVESRNLAVGPAGKSSSAAE